MLGTFYRAESPGAAPFVEVGRDGGARHHRVHHRGDEDDELGARRGRGTVVEVCPDNGELVEYGAPLFRVRAAVKRVFIPNRGEIALRIVHACRELGLESRGRRLRGRPRRARRPPGRPGRVPRTRARGRELPARRRRRPGRARHRLRRDPPRLRLSVREPAAGRPRARARPGVRRAAAPRRSRWPATSWPPAPQAQRAGVPVLPGGEVGTAQQAPPAGRRRSATRCWSRRPAAVAGAGSSAHSDGDELEAMLGLARGEAGGRLRRRARLRRAADRVGAPRRGADRRRRARRRRPSRRARLLGAAPLSEGGRGGPGARRCPTPPARAAARGRGVASPGRSATRTWARSSSCSTPTATSSSSSRSTAGSRSSIRSPRPSPAATWSRSSCTIAAGRAAGLRPGRRQR